MKRKGRQEDNSGLRESDPNRAFSMSISEALIMRAKEMGGRLKVRSGLNPMLWLCAIITTPSLILYGIKPDPSEWLLLFAFAPEAAAILGFFFLLIVDRPYLQSEQFQIRKLELEMIEEKGKPPIEITDEDLLLQSEAVPLLPEQVDE